MYSMSLSKIATLFRERIVFLRFSEGDKPISFFASLSLASTLERL